MLIFTRVTKDLQQLSNAIDHSLRQRSRFCFRWTLTVVYHPPWNGKKFFLGGYWDFQPTSQVWLEKSRQSGAFREPLGLCSLPLTSHSFRLPCHFSMGTFLSLESLPGVPFPPGDDRTLEPQYLSVGSSSCTFSWVYVTDTLFHLLYSLLLLPWLT